MFFVFFIYYCNVYVKKCLLFSQKAYVYTAQSFDIQYKSLPLLQMFIPDPLDGNTATGCHGNTAMGPTMRRPRACGYVIIPWLDSFHNTYVILAGTIC